MEADISCDVVVVGAGISGMTCAYLLTKEKKSVVVIDDGNIGSGESGRTTAHLTCVLDDRYYRIEKKNTVKKVHDWLHKVTLLPLT